jgi:hypothetical protein
LGDVDGTTAGRNDRLDREYQTLDDPRTCRRFSDCRYRRPLPQSLSDAVARKLAKKVEAVIFDVDLHRVADIADVSANLDCGDSPPQCFPGDVQDRASLW